MTDRATSPRAHRDPAFLEAKRARLDEPHVAPLNALAASLERADRLVPRFDPDDGGTAARVLLLLEAPGRRAMAADGHAGSGMVSQDNADGTAENVFVLLREARLGRADVVLWNVVPWYVGSTERIRGVRPTDVEEAAEALTRLVGALPALELVIAVGRPALDGWMRYLASAPRLLPTLAAPHPSPRSLHARPALRGEIVRVLQRAAEHVARSSLNP